MSDAPLKAILYSDTASLAGLGRISATQQGLAMKHRFLRDEAARFRAMADDTDHEATKLRRLATATDYEERAKVADDGAGPDAAEMDVAEMDGEVAVQTEPSVGKATRVKLDMKNGTGLKETVLVERRPIVRRG